MINQTAAQLVVAVSDRDDQAIRDTVHDLSRRELRDLAVWLARHVNPDLPFTARAALSPEEAIQDCIALTAEFFGVTPATLKSRSRRREHIDPRHVAQYAARLCGASFPAIGREFGQDHTTVINAVGRVGECSRLRRIAHRVADHVGRRDLTPEDLHADSGKVA